MSITEKRLLGFDAARLNTLGGALTAAEIAQQPALWNEVRKLMAQRSSDIASFLTPLFAKRDLRIILTGAGTSAFIGKCLMPQMLKRLGRRVEAIPTTDLVSGPELYFQRDVPTLLISFARSGSSPESLAAVELANKMCGEVHHIFFTCNAQGELFSIGESRANVLAILLPEATHDRGFAMTSSFTSMLYSASLVFDLIDASEARCHAISAAAADVLNRALPVLNSLVEGGFERVVYLGSNGLRGLAEEAALKLLELTDGRVIASFDSPLGFRHGPKTIVDDKTLVVLFISADKYTAQYDLDLLAELQLDRRAGRLIALTPVGGDHDVADYFGLHDLSEANELELALPYIVFAQIFAFMQSLAIGNTPDFPSRSGTVNRVVQGVRIYPFISEANYVSGR